MHAVAPRRAVAYVRLPEAAIVDAAHPDVAPPIATVHGAAIARWAEARDVEIASWHIDVGVTGVTPIAERPALVAAYGALSDHGAGMLVAAEAAQFSLDELVSRLIEQAALMRRAVLETADGSRAVAHDEKGRALGASRRTSEHAPAEAWSRDTLALARAHERVALRARFRAAVAERRARGERVGNPPFGFRVAGDGVHVEPDPREQEIAATVRQLHDEGLSQRKIAAVLTARGVTGRTGGPFGQTQIANILRVAR